MESTIHSQPRWLHRGRKFHAVDTPNGSTTSPVSQLAPSRA